MKEIYVYPAQITALDEDRVEIRFIDFPEIVIEPADFESAIKMAQETLATTLFRYDETNRAIPEPTKVNRDAILIQVWMPYYKNMAKEVYVRKSATIPEKLDILARKNSVNYSAALVRGLKLELGIED